MTIFSWALHCELDECSEVSNECTASIFRIDSVSLKMQSAAVKPFKYMHCKIQQCCITNR